MPSRPLSEQTLQLIRAVRESLEAALGCDAALEESTLFGSYCFFVDGKLCLGVKNDELLVRLPPARHEQLLEMQGLRELSPGGGMRGYFWIEPDGYASRERWNAWIGQALAYNPEAKASPRRRKAGVSRLTEPDCSGKTPKKHPIFGSE